MYDVIIGEQRFAIADSRLETIREDLVQAVREGGAIIRFGEDSPHPVEVLVTPHSSVRIVKRTQDSAAEPETRAAPSEPETDYHASDVDWWLEWS